VRELALTYGYPDLATAPPPTLKPAPKARGFLSRLFPR